MSGHKERFSIPPYTEPKSNLKTPTASEYTEKTHKSFDQVDYSLHSAKSDTNEPDSGSSNTQKDLREQDLNGDTECNLLDILSADMDFEQAYNMYTTLQQKNAISSIEQLEKVQMLNQQYVSNLSTTSRQSAPSQQQQQHQRRAPFPSSITQFTTNSPFSFELGSTAASATSSNPDEHTFNFHRSQILSGGLSNKNYMFMNDDENSSQNPSTTKNSSISKPREEEEEFDQFFSNTESNALEKFLDNLAHPAEESSLQFYNNQQMGTDSPGQEFNDLFDLHTMKPIPMGNKSKLGPGFSNRVQGFDQYNIQKSNSLPVNMTQQGLMEHETLKKELTEAFSHPHRDHTPLKDSPNQLPTPIDAKDSNRFLYENRKRSSNELITPPSSDNNDNGPNFKHEKHRSESLGVDDDKSGTKKRRRSSSKPLLSLEQKRLNHSHSEQKRRQMCKLAYERCLRLIIDIEAFNKLPATVSDSLQRKSKRARVNKDGLPNLSKHSALIRISNEIELITSKNNSLKAILEQRGIRDHLSFAPPVAREIE